MGTPGFLVSCIYATKNDCQSQKSCDSLPTTKRGDLVELTDSKVSPPIRTRMPGLTYPPMARRLGRQAKVAVRVLVDENGLPAQVELAGPKVGLGFDDAALEAVRGMRWKPATKDNVAVKVWLQVSIDFHL